MKCSRDTLRRKLYPLMCITVFSAAYFVYVLYGQFIQWQYLTPRKVKVNPMNHAFIINGSQICATDAKYMTLLIVVPSTPSHYSVRHTIRATYGSYSKKSFFIDHTTVEVTLKLMFLVGKDGDKNTDRNIRHESREYRDIVQADFIESYRNLTRKMLIALKWVSVYCSDIDFLVKVDEDVFVNFPQLTKALHARPYDVKGAVYGRIVVHPTARRKGKWGVSKDEFPLTHYPSYAAGNSYVISGNNIPRMYNISEYLPYMPMEDVFITGWIIWIVKAKVKYLPFVNTRGPVQDPCYFAKNRKMLKIIANVTEMEKLWKACTSFSETCLNVSLTEKCNATFLK